ncbi:hypothetical protein ABVK25_001771 [Lepraria finkii]|uniref:Uncharacterized protein n=1 Tax=Lepraria finkii TaxID=1340010 RepID=A0ABR4BK13_9LECA
MDNTLLPIPVAAVWSNTVLQDPNNNQHKYRRPSAHKSIVTTFQHSWAHPIVENVKNTAKDIAEELSPVLQEHVEKAAGWLRGAATRISGQSSKTRASSLDDDSDRGWESAPEAFDTGNAHVKGEKEKASLSRQDAQDYGWRPDANAFITGNMQASRSTKEFEDLGSKESERPKEPRYKSSFAHRKEKKETLEAESSRGGWSTRKGAPKASDKSEATHRPKPPVHETQADRRARIKAE